MGSGQDIGCELSLYGVLWMSAEALIEMATALEFTSAAGRPSREI